MPNRRWTKEMDAHLRDLHIKGNLSASQTAAIMGNGLSRSAIISRTRWLTGNLCPSDRKRVDDCKKNMKAKAARNAEIRRCRRLGIPAKDVAKVFGLCRGWIYQIAGPA